MLKRSILILFLFQMFAAIDACDRYIPILSDSDSDSEEIDNVSAVTVKNLCDVAALKVLSPDDLLLQAHKVLSFISLRKIDAVTINRHQDGSYLLDRELFQQAKSFLQNEYDSLSHSWCALGTGTIFDALFTLKFDSVDAVQSYVDWLKRSYKYAFVEAIKQKFEQSEQQVLKRFEKFKDDQKAEVNKILVGCEKAYPTLQNYSTPVMTSAGIIAACAYGKRIVQHSSLKKYYNYVAIPVSLGVIGRTALNVYAHYVKSKKLDATMTDLQSILRSIDHEFLKVNSQGYDHMLALFMRDFDNRCDVLLHTELKRLHMVKPAQANEQQGAMVLRQPVAPGALVVKKIGNTSVLQKFTGFFRKMAQ